MSVTDCNIVKKILITMDRKRGSWFRKVLKGRTGIGDQSWSQRRGPGKSGTWFGDADRFFSCEL